MADDESLDFATGGIQAEEAHKAEAAARKARYGNKTYLTSLLKDDGDTVMLRFLMDERQWIETKQHNFVPTKAAPKDKPSDADWPDKIGAVCRYTPVVRGGKRVPAYGDCYICDHMLDEKGKKYFPSMRMWALAAVREPVNGTQEMVDAGLISADRIGKRVAIVDATDEIDEVDNKGNSTGQKVYRKRLVIVNMALSNFCSPLFTQAKYNETLLDRDYLIVRKGEAKANKVLYEHVAQNPIETQDPDDPSKMVVFDLRDKRFAALYEGHGIDLAELRQMVAHRCSKDFYDRYFDPRVEVTWRTSEDEDAKGEAKTETAKAETTNTITQEALAQMRARVMESNPMGAAAAASN